MIEMVHNSERIGIYIIVSKKHMTGKASDNIAA